MNQILVLGAGHTAPFLIQKLLDMSAERDWFVTVGDVDVEAARALVAGHPHGDAIAFDVNDESLRGTQIAKADVVVNLLPPLYQGLVAWDCVSHGRHMVSVSYQDQTVRDLSLDAQRKGVLLLCELGLDPGIDHMSAMRLITRLREEGCRITGFCSYGSGLPAPNQNHNPLRYAVTWNPRNVVMSGEDGTQYMEDGRIKIVPHHHVFHHTWAVEVDGVGTLEAYPNSDSLRYMQAFGLEDVRTMIRGTLRYPGWSETWAQIVRLGLPNEALQIPELASRSAREVIEMFLPSQTNGEDTAKRVANFLNISPTGRIMENMRWLGLFDDTPLECAGETAAAMLIHILTGKLRLEEGQRDMVVLVHQLDVERKRREKERITSTLVVEGEGKGITAMSRTVGLPVAHAVDILLAGDIALTGFHIPTHPAIYEPVLARLEADGLVFKEEITKPGDREEG